MEVSSNFTHGRMVDGRHLGPDRGGASPARAQARARLGRGDGLDEEPTFSP